MSGQIRLTGYAAIATLTTATALSAVFAGDGWIGPVTGAILAVAVGTLLVRQLPMPSAFEAPVGALLVLCWLDALYARPQAYLGFVPSGAAMQRLGHLARTGFHDVHKLPTPVPTHHGLVLIATIGVAAVALVVDLLVVAVRRATLAGLPLLGLFTVCAVTSRHGVGLVAFVLGCAGYFAMLFADHRERVARWGAAATGAVRNAPPVWSGDPWTAPAPASVGRRIGAMAIGVGVVLPWVIPGLHTGIHRPGTGSVGSSSTLTINPIVSVANDLTSTAATPVLSYRSSSVTPGYLRLTSLNEYDGARSTFSASRLVAPSTARVNGTLPGSPVAPHPVTTEVTVSQRLALHWLPLTEQTTSVQVGGDWRYDPASATVFSASDDTSGLRYSSTNVDTAPSRGDLEAVTEESDGQASPVGDLALDHVSTAVHRLTAQVTRHAATPYDKALAIQQFLTQTPFSYSTSVPADNSGHALDDFLLRSHTGFCQQYAGAMAVMARLVGIPARVAVGFTRGVRQADGSWLVTTHDAHAWPELWFAGYGWLPFEPTPRSDGQVLTPSYAAPGAGGNGPGNGKHQAGGSPHAKGTTPAGRAKPLPGDGRLGGAGTPSGGGGVGAGLISLLVAAIVVLALLAPATARIVVRRRRHHQLRNPARAADVVWAELRDVAIDHGLSWDDGRSPRELALRIGGTLGSDGGAAEALGRLRQAEERARYAPAATAPTRDAWRDVDVIRSTLRHRLSRRARIGSRILPRSVLLHTRGGYRPLSRLLDRLDRIRATSRRRLHRARTTG